MRAGCSRDSWAVFAQQVASPAKQLSGFRDCRPLWEIQLAERRFSRQDDKARARLTAVPHFQPPPPLGQELLPLWELACKRIPPLRTRLRLQASPYPGRIYGGWGATSENGLAANSCLQITKDPAGMSAPAELSQADTNCGTAVPSGPFFVFRTVRPSRFPAGPILPGERE